MIGCRSITWTATMFPIVVFSAGRHHEARLSRLRSAAEDVSVSRIVEPM
jgi:hypothetical protein